MSELLKRKWHHVLIALNCNNTDYFRKAFCLFFLFFTSIVIYGCTDKQTSKIEGNDLGVKKMDVKADKGSGSIDTEIIYGKSGDVICKIKKKYNDDGKLIKERRKILSDEYKTDADEPAYKPSEPVKYPVVEVIKYSYKNGYLTSGKKIRNGELVERWTYDSDGKKVKEIKLEEYQNTEDNLFSSGEPEYR